VSVTSEGARNLDTAFGAVQSLARTTPVGDLPALLGVLEAAKAEAWGRLSSPPMAAPAPEAVADRLLTADEAAAIAQVRTKRIYSWAQGQRWAHRPSTRCLRISEGAFRRWLEARS
jgi:hypothetical protein